jgi:hypothetical protein
MGEAESQASVLVAVESGSRRATVVRWAVACGARVAVVSDARQLCALHDASRVRLIVCSPGIMESAARRASRRAAEAGRFVAVLAVDPLNALLQPRDGPRWAVTEAVRSTVSPSRTDTEQGRQASRRQALEWGPICMDPAVDRVWVAGERNDAIHGELLTLLRLLLASPSAAVTWKDVDQTLQKVRSSAAHRKMAQRLRTALGDHRQVVETCAGGMRLVPLDSSRQIAASVTKDVTPDERTQR